MFLKITLVVLLFDPRIADSFALPKSIASHLTAVLLVGVLAGLIALRPKMFPVFEPMHAAALLVMVAFVVSTLFALDQTVAAFGAWRRYLGLTQMLDNGVLFFAVATLFRDRTSQGRLLLVALTSAAVVATYTIIQRTGMDPIRYFQGTTPVATLGQPDLLGGYLGIAGVTGVSAFAIVRIAPLRFRLAALGVGLACLGAAATTGIRNTVLAVAAGLVLAAMLALIGHGGRRLAVTFFGLIAVAGTVAVVNSPIGARLDPAHLINDPAVLARFEIWHTGLTTVGQRPIFGLGPDNFSVAYPHARSESSVVLNGVGILQSSTHDWLVYLLTSGGMAAAAAVVTLVTLGTATALRLARQSNPACFALVPLGAYVAQGLVDVNDVSIDWIFWVTLGVLVASTQLPPASVAKTRHSNLAALSIAVAAIGLVFVWANADTRWRASEAFAISSASASRGEGLRAVESGRQAVAFDPRRAENWGVFAASLSAAGSPSAAATAYSDAAQRSPWLPLYWRSAALQRLASGDETSAIGLFTRALNADPYDVESLNVLARLSLNRGQPDAAAQYAARSLNALPRERGALQIMAIADVRLGRFGHAEEVLTRALDDGDDAQLRVWLGQVYLAEGRKTEALAEANRALALQPSMPEAIALREAAAR